MPLTIEQVTTLKHFVNHYNFPLVYFDFIENQENIADTVEVLEQSISSQLRSAELEEVKHGLANVVYWGFSQMGVRDTRVGRFLDGINQEQVVEFQQLVEDQQTPSLREIKLIKMPQYSGVSFVSKILAFLSPDTHCVMDKQLMKMRTEGHDRPLNAFNSGNQITITARSEAAYDDWRAECSRINTVYFGSRYRTVDIERGFFAMIQSGSIEQARDIYTSI